ncbi:hypothetical protein, partial [Pseudomonas aeruginosa]
RAALSALLGEAQGAPRGAGEGAGPSLAGGCVGAAQWPGPAR